MTAKRQGKRKLLQSHPQDKLMDALNRMRKADISQLPVFEGKALAGAVYEDDILSLMLKGRDIKKMIVREVMSAPPPVISPQARIESILRLVSPEKPAVLVQTGKTSYDIITKYDILNAVSRFAENGRAAQN